MRTSSILQQATSFTQELSIPNDVFTMLRSHNEFDTKSSFEREKNADDYVG